MNKLLTFRTTPEQKNYISSDFHMHHTGPRGAPIPLWKSRGYNSAEHMTDGIISTLNQTVGANDNLFFLGDWCLDCTESQFNEDLARIQCQNIYMLFGNHNSRVKDAYRHAVDARHGLNGDLVEVYPTRYKNLIFLGNYQEIVVDKQLYILCHYPVDVFNQQGHGSIMLTGHSHGNYAKTRAEYQFGKRLDIGWDQFNRPLSFDEVRAICDKKQIVSEDHH
jgi:calcineurin-like phosphoesterase family protein